MAETAFETRYRKEMVMGFEKWKSLVKHTVTGEFMRSGDSAVFLIGDSGGAAAKNRGANGIIPTRPDDLTQVTATLKEWHDIVEKSNFNIFAGQGAQRALMQKTSRAVINRKMDTDINDALETATGTWGGAAVPTIALINTAKVKLANAFADDPEDNLWAQITPAFHAYLNTLDQFTSVDYISDTIREFPKVSRGKAFDWYGVKWIVNPELTGTGSADATCLMYNQRAIGHAADMSGMSTVVDYDKKNDSSYARCSIYMGSALLQNAGVVKMRANDSAYS